jgi:hypothetical protein
VVEMADPRRLIATRNTMPTSQSNDNNVIGLNKWLRLAIALCAVQYPFTVILFPTIPSKEILLAMPVAIGALLAFWNTKNVKPYIFLLVAYVAILGMVHFNFEWSGNPFSEKKLGSFEIAIFIFGLSVSFCLVEGENEAFSFAVAILGVAVAVSLVSGATTWQAQRFTFNDANPIWLARVLGFSLLGSVSLFLKLQKWRYVIAVEIVLLLYCILITGSRGPLIAAVAGCALLAMQSVRSRLVLKATISIAVVASISALVVGTGLIDWLIEFRAIRTQDNSASFRILMLQHATRLIAEFPEGIGLGAFFYQGATYPHNIFVELVVEWGWLPGCIAISIILGSIFGLALKMKEFNFVLAVYLMEILNASFSGDITSPRMLYGIVFASYSWAFFEAKSRQIDGALQARLV